MRDSPIRSVNALATSTEHSTSISRTASTIARRRGREAEREREASSDQRHGEREVAPGSASAARAEARGWRRRAARTAPGRRGAGREEVQPVAVRDAAARLSRLGGIGRSATYGRSRPCRRCAWHRDAFVSGPARTSERQHPRDLVAELTSDARERLLGDLLDERERVERRARSGQLALGERAHRERHLRPDRVQGLVEGLFGDRDGGTRTGTTRAGPQTNRTSGARAGLIADEPTSASAFLRISADDGGYSSSSSAASVGCTPVVTASGSRSRAGRRVDLDRARERLGRRQHRRRVARGLARVRRRRRLGRERPRSVSGLYWKR